MWLNGRSRTVATPPPGPVLVGEGVLRHLADGVGVLRAKGRPLVHRLLGQRHAAVSLARADHDHARGRTLGRHRLQQVQLAEDVVRQRRRRVGEGLRHARLRGEVEDAVGPHGRERRADGARLGEIRRDPPNASSHLAGAIAPPPAGRARTPRHPSRPASTPPGGARRTRRAGNQEAHTSTEY